MNEELERTVSCIDRLCTTDSYGLDCIEMHVITYAEKQVANLIDYIENDAEIAMPINELMHEDGRHLSKKEYGKVLLKYLVKELRSKTE